MNGHNLDPRGPIDLNSSLMARPLPGLGDGHRNCPKSPSLARVISFQSIDTKWHFRATFYETESLFWFSLFLLPTVRILAVFYSYKLNIYLQSIHSSLYLQSNDGRFSTDHTQFTIKRKMLMILNDSVLKKLNYSQYLTILNDPVRSQMDPMMQSYLKRYWIF